MRGKLSTLAAPIRLKRRRKVRPIVRPLTFFQEKHKAIQCFNSCTWRRERNWNQHSLAALRSASRWFATKRCNPSDLVSRRCGRCRDRGRPPIPRACVGLAADCLSPTPSCPVHPIYPLPGGRTGTSQISLAYSLIVRSEENQPMCAVLRAAACHQACLSRQRRNTERWASK